MYSKNTFDESFQFKVPNSEFVIKMMQKDHLKQAADVLVEALQFPTEPLCSFVKMSEEELYEFITPFLHDRLSEQLSFVAVDTKGDVVGLFFAEDFGYGLKGLGHPQYYLDLQQKYPKWAVAAAIFDELEDVLVKKLKEKNISKAIHLYWAAIRKRARGRRILKHALRLVHEMGQQRGYEIMFGEATNRFSRSVFLREFKDSGEIWYELKYDDYVYGKEKKKPYFGCNEAALKFLKDNGLYKEVYGDWICKTCSLLVAEIPKKKKE